MPKRYTVHICPDGTRRSLCAYRFEISKLHAEAADRAADQLGPDDQAQDGHDGRVVLGHPIPQASQDLTGPVAQGVEHNDRGRNAYGRDDGEDDVRDGLVGGPDSGLR
jgi:hypothetical protein